MTKVIGGVALHLEMAVVLGVTGIVIETGVLEEEEHGVIQAVIADPTVVLIVTVVMTVTEVLNVTVMNVIEGLSVTVDLIVTVALIVIGKEDLNATVDLIVVGWIVVGWIVEEWIEEVEVVVDGEVVTPSQREIVANVIRGELGRRGPKILAGLVLKVRLEEI